MATSGTVGRTVIDVVTAIEHAARKCGVVASMLTAENLESARQDLFMLLTALAVKGVNLWCVKKQVLATRQGKTAYTLAVGTEDLVSEPLLRRGTAELQTALGVAVATYTPTSALLVKSVTVAPAAAGPYALVLEGSPDGLAWTEYGSADGTLAAIGDTVCFDAEPVTATLGFWRVRETVDLAATFTSVYFFSACTEVPMGQMARSDYLNLPVKETQTNAPLQFWYDKQAVAPLLYLWQTPSSDTQQIVVWYQRQIEDVGPFNATLDVPQRWLEAIIYMLAERLILELPKALVDPTRYTLIPALATKYENEAADSETDGAPIRFRPNLRAYTR